MAGLMLHHRENEPSFSLGRLTLNVANTEKYEVSIAMTTVYRWTVIASFVGVLLTTPAMAADCPVASMAPSEVEKLILAAPDCQGGLTIFESCGMGGTSDVIVGQVVIEKCEATFDGKLSVAQRRDYERTQRACDRKYARQTGTEYRSLTAFCLAAAAGRVAKQFAKAGQPAKK
jgi:hypothetical protein